MFRVAFHDPRYVAMQNRMARTPRWAWLAVGIAVILPMALLLTSVLVVAAVSGLAVLAVVMLLLWIRGLWFRMTGRLRRDGRRNVRIVIRPPQNFVN